MLSRVFGLGAVLGLAAVGCRKPTEQDTLLLIDRMKDATRLYFSNLNHESLGRKEDLRAQQRASAENPTLPLPTGFVFNTFFWDPDKFIVQGFKCRTCATRLILPAPSLEYLCKACGHSPYQDHGLNPNLKVSPCTQCVGTDHKPRPPEERFVGRDSTLWRDEGVKLQEMFEITQRDPEKPLEAVVRYVRQSWTYDERGVVSVPPKALERAAVDSKWLPMAGSGQGFHRKDATFVGGIKFRFKGGNLLELEREPEEPVRPWKDLKVGK